MSDTQTAYLLALAFDLLPGELEQVAVNRLAGDVQERGHLTTGFLGTPYLNPVLSRYGHHAAAYKLLLRESYPSWLYPVTMGATTIWERWDGIKPDGLFQSAEMNSFNHYAYGAIGDWLYRVAAGLQEAAPGYKEIVVKPHSGGGFTHMEAELMTPYGKAGSEWKIQDNQIFMNVTVPVNTSATVYLPAISANNITESGNPLKSVKEISITGIEENYVVVKIGSGSYSFTINK
jgi:alpha-L-rhamnosidase